MPRIFGRRLILAILLTGLATMAVGQTLAPAPTAAPAPSTRPAVRDTHEMLSAVLWVQTSAEYRFLCEGVYASARDGLDKALADKSWTAVLEQTGDVSNLPPAVIMDIDETVLEHSFYQAELVKRGISPVSRMWRECVATYCMPAVPGALEFINYARSRGITVFFVTNRETDLKQSTRRNLIQLGIDLPDSPDTLFVAGEQPGWTSDKSSRRAFVAKTHRVLMQFGDDFGDFLAGGNNSPERRFELAGAQKEMWGRRWFLLPNPLTGSWTTALSRGIPAMSESQSLDQRRSLVKGYDSIPKLSVP